MMPSTLREDGALTKDLGSWSQRGQHHRGKVQRNKVESPSMHTNLVNGNWLLLVTCTGPRTKSSGFSIKQCQILMIFLFPATTMNSLTLLGVLMNVCYRFLLLLSFCCHSLCSSISAGLAIRIFGISQKKKKRKQRKPGKLKQLISDKWGVSNT